MPFEQVPQRRDTGQCSCSVWQGEYKNLSRPVHIKLYHRSSSKSEGHAQSYSTLQRGVLQGTASAAVPHAVHGFKPSWVRSNHEPDMWSRQFDILGIVRLPSRVFQHNVDQSDCFKIFHGYVCGDYCR